MTLPEWLQRLLGEDVPSRDNGRVEELEREQARLVARLEALQIRVDVSSRHVHSVGPQETGREIADR